MQWCLGGGVFVSPAPAYADGYVDGTGNNIYYGFKTDAQYAEAHFNIDVEYYDTFEHARDGGTTGIDPLGKFVRVHYLSNCHNNATADEWKFRPMWWFGVPAGLKDPQYIHFKRIEKLTKNGKQQVQPAGSSQKITTDDNGYGAVSDRHYNSTKEWSNLSNFYFSGNNIATKGWKQLVGLGDKDNSKTYDNAGDTEKQWDIYKKDTQGLKGIFVDWESAGQRWYDMTYVSEMEETTWKNRDQHPLRFAAGVYRFAGNWHYAAGQKHNTPKIADYFNLTYPAVTKVKDTKKLISDEQTAVKNAVVDANKNAKYYSDLVEKVEVSENGDATITFKDKTTRTMPASLLVTKDETDSDKYKPTLPDAIPVVNPSALTKEDKEAVIAAFKKKNENNKDFNDHLAKDNAIAFDKDGKNLVVTYEDGSTAKIPASELVFQGPKISDWAPYVVPDAIEVADPSKLSETEKKQVTEAFDKANADLDVYTAAKKNGVTPVTFDKDFKNAIITWADGSTTEIPSWQFLKQKPKTTPSPEPQPPAPTPAAEKEFIVEAPATQTRVKFDPFNMKEADLTTNSQALDANKKALMKVKGKDSKDNSDVTITDVSYSVKDGKGYITFKADKYKDATYPMSVFFKNDSSAPTPQQPDTTLHHPGQKTAYQYYVDPVQVDNVNSPSPQDQLAAFKKFIQKNYSNVNDSGLSAGLYTLNENNTPVSGVTNMQRYVKGKNNGAGVVSFSLNPNGTIAVQGFETGENSSKKLFDVPLTDLYVKKNSSQPQTDTTIDDLKKQAKALLKQRQDDGLTNVDLAKSGIKNPDKLNGTGDGSIDAMAQGTTAEKDLRDLIRKLTDAKKAEYKYNTNPYEVSDPTAKPTDNDFQAAVKQFLKANYEDSSATEKIDNLTFTANSATLTGKGWTPKAGTSDLELNSDTVTYGITTVVMNGDGKSVDFKNGDTVLFTVPADKLFKKKAAPEPTPSAEDLKKFKEQAKQQIDRNPKLTDEQKKQFKDKIDKADTKEKIQEILKKANEQVGKNTVTPEQLKQKEKEEKEKRENEQKEKDKKEREKKQEEQTTKDKKSANDTIDNLSDLTQDEKDKLKEKLNGKNGDTTKPGAKTPEEVQQIVNEANARNDAHKAIKKELPFLDHGNFDDSKKGETSHADDVALHELLGGTPGKDQTLTDLETALKDSNATAESINNALAKAKLQNTSNEQNAKNAGLAKLDAKKAELDAAYNALNAEQKAKAKEKYDAAVNEINTAKGKVNSATKPSDIKNAVDGVKTSFEDANKAIEDAKGKRDTTQNTYDDQSELNKEKEAQKKRIQDSDLPEADKQKAIDDINAATKLGDPTGIADRALKAQKIKDALKAIDDFKHLNKAQKDAFKAILKDTDASDHTNDDGTTSDDIDDALANAANTDNAMARLEELKKKANDFKNEKDGKYSKLTNSDDDQNKKKAFDGYLADATTLTTADKGDAKNADQVNELYNDLLKAMRAIDPDAQSAGLKTDALAAEIKSDKGLKPDTTVSPATKGDSVYTTASKEKKEAFDKALTDAETALKTAEDTKKPDAKKMSAEEEATAQKAVDDALDKLIKARLALDGVDTTKLQTEIDKESATTSSDAYKYDSQEKQNNYNTALQEAKELIDKLTGKKKADAGEEDVTTKTQAEKQKLVDKALAKLKAAEEALDGKKPVEPTPTPTPTPTPSPIPTPGAGTGAGTGDVDPDSEDGYGVNDNAPTTVDKGELNIQIDSAEADSQPGNAGAGNAGNTNAGAGANSGNAANVNAANANANAANGANAAAVNAAVESNQAVKQADAQVSKAQAALDAALAEAKKVAADPNATQAQVDAAARKLAAAGKALAAAKAHAADVRASVRAQVLKSGSVAQLSKTGSDVSAFGLFAATISAAGAALFAAKRRGISRHSNK
ncbi:GA module [Gardnerella vaginalis]|uniref:GA module n=1 Tax=Gardnerella vaginalis TaxID=2702 RepID=UPI0039F1398C